MRSQDKSHAEPQVAEQGFVNSAALRETNILWQRRTAASSGFKSNGRDGIKKSTKFLRQNDSTLTKSHD